MALLSVLWPSLSIAPVGIESNQPEGILIAEFNSQLHLLVLKATFIAGIAGLELLLSIAPVGIESHLMRWKGIRSQPLNCTCWY